MHEATRTMSRDCGHSFQKHVVRFRCNDEWKFAWERANCRAFFDFWSWNVGSERVRSSFWLLGFNRLRGSGDSAGFERSELLLENYDDAFDSVIFLSFFSFFSLGQVTLRRSFSISLSIIRFSPNKISFLLPPTRSYRYIQFSLDPWSIENQLNLIVECR